MTKRTIKETVREYDEVGKLVRETVTETMEEDDTCYNTSCYTYPATTSAPLGSTTDNLPDQKE